MKFLKKIFSAKWKTNKTDTNSFVPSKSFSQQELERQARIKETVRRESTEIKGFTPTMTPQMYEIQNTINIQDKEINKGFTPTMTPDMYVFLNKSKQK